MDSYLQMGGTQPGVHRRLSRLYNDTKRKSDFVTTESTQHVEADPEIKSLHRKLRIQKDRFVTWGLEWSDPNQSAEVLIDSSLSKAGLSDLVGSIMSTIKDILAEAEPLWMSSRRLIGEIEPPAQSARRGEKIQMVVWDKSRFEDLIRDLTSSIDTLYDLSRTRSSSSHSAAMSKHTAQPEDLRPFESSRIQTPRQIDPKTLQNLRAMQAVPMTELAEAPRSHEIVFMDKQAYAELTSTTSGTRQPHAPLLLEYATFDSIYSITGISPPMTRFEKLSAALQAEPQRAPGSWTGLPRLLGYFEDMDNSRFGLVYQFPRTFNPVTYEHLTQNPLYNLCTLKNLLTRRDFEPKLEAKFRLAANLANTVFDMHARGITHGNIGTETVSFCNAVGTDPEVSGITQGEVDIRRPLISSFDLFTDPQSPDNSRSFSLYKHQLDPRNNPESPFASKADSKTFDLYSLAMVLLSIGLWTKLEDLVPNMEFPSIPESIIDRLAVSCGTLYAKVVQTCWNAVELEMAGPEATEEKEVVRRVQLKASRYLEACCILDGVSALEERLGDDLGDNRRESARLSTASAAAGPSQEAKSEKRSSSISAAPHDAKGKELHSVGLAQVQGQVQAKTSAPEPAEGAAPIKQKVRLFPHVPLPPEIVDRWNTYIMPQVNSALRSFYRKNPESVEVSLESIGENPQRTKPTVLVVCTSVGKVKAILKKKLGELFDGTQGVGLKVCSGRMLRSRKESTSRSMADDDQEIVAANPDYQPQPTNGASIGAWIGDRHLPPVSLGGMLTVDDRLYGMTVHHMLDVPEHIDEDGKQGEYRSTAGSQAITDLHAWYAQQYQNTSDTEPESSGTEDYACDFSDSDAYSESAITSDYSDEEDEEEEQSDDECEPGDILGIEPGCGDDYIITQPAMDDMGDGYYVDPETQDEEHLLSCTLGEMYASSGIRRRTENGMVHEIDWALFQFNDERLPPGNIIPVVGAGSLHSPIQRTESRVPTSNVSPTTIVPTSKLPGLQVQCMARTSGLQTGLILPAIASVKIYGRTTPSQTYQVSGTRPPADSIPHEKQSTLPMGIPGDSGAWVIDRDQGRVCGHILAFSQRKRVAYICPMDVMILDIAEALEANEIRLPGGEIVYLREGTMRGGELRFEGIGRSLTQRSRISECSTGTGFQGSEGEAGDDENDEPPTLMSRFGSHKRRSQRSSVATPTVRDRNSYLSASAQRESHVMAAHTALTGALNEEKEEESDSAIEVDKGLARRLRQMEIEMSGTGGGQPGGQLTEAELMSKWRGYDV
ncbi:hypothetical protein QBC43DRAFT_289476 [Cladorrhinum sp. PSN259]|nr:hypothetical protein QBC43DRAFT_289476 [Cladorrhinum sp. PSN259]